MPELLLEVSFIFFQVIKIIEQLKTKRLSLSVMTYRPEAFPNTESDP